MSTYLKELTKYAVHEGSFIALLRNKNTIYFSLDTTTMNLEATESDGRVLLTTAGQPPNNYKTAPKSTEHVGNSIVGDVLRAHGFSVTMKRSLRYTVIYKLIDSFFNDKAMNLAINHIEKGTSIVYITKDERVFTFRLFTVKQSGKTGLYAEIQNWKTGHLEVVLVTDYSTLIQKLHTWG